MEREQLRISGTITLPAGLVDAGPVEVSGIFDIEASPNIAASALAAVNLLAKAFDKAMDSANQRLGQRAN
jgi:hypothetical protein